MKGLTEAVFRRSKFAALQTGNLIVHWKGSIQVYTHTVDSSLDLNFTVVRCTLATSMCVCLNTSSFKFVWSMCWLYKMKFGTRRTVETPTKFLNNGLTCMRFTALLRLPQMRLAIALNFEGKLCDLNSQWAVGPGAMASGMLSDMEVWSPAQITVSVCSVVDMAES